VRIGQGERHDIQSHRVIALSEDVKAHFPNPLKPPLTS